MFRRILDSPYFLYGLAALLLIAGVLSMFRVELPNRSVGDVQDIADLGERDDLNVVFILIDTLRADRLGSYGYERDTSPVMDLLAQGGVRFAKAEAQSSWTKTSMASLWTGLFPPRTGILRFDDGLPESATLPAEILEEAGYVTGGIFRNGWVGANFGFKQGFQTYLKPEGREDPDGVESSLPGTTKLPGTDVDVTLAGLEFLRTHAHNKFFLYLHYMDIHQYTYEKGYADLYEGATISDNYDRAIRWTDKQVDRVVQELEDRGIMERTIIVIASDHGEAFLEHGKEGHAQDLHHESIAVPFIMSLPFIVEDGVVVDSVVRNVDIWPTVLDILGLDPLPNPDGVSLVPAILAADRGEETEDLPSYAYLDQTWGQTEGTTRPLVALRTDGRKIMFNPGEENTFQSWEVASDPLETTNLRRKPEWTEALEAEANERTGLEPEFGTTNVELDELYRAQLRALGYIVK